MANLREKHFGAYEEWRKIKPEACASWQDFKGFLRDMGDKPPKSYTEQEIANILNTQRMEVIKLKKQLEIKIRENQTLRNTLKENSSDRGW